jgi:protein TonB
MGTKTVKVDLGPAGIGQVMDIGLGGVRVRSVAPLRRDSEIPLRIHLPSGIVPCSGVVVWSNPAGAAGIRFASLGDTEQKSISTWVSTLEQTTSPPVVSDDADEYTRICSQIKKTKLNNADALSVIAHRVLEVSPATGSAIALGKAENMVCLGSAGDAPELGTVIPPTAGLTGECVRTRKLVLCHNAKTDPRVGRGTQLGSAVLVPLLVNGDIRGVLEAFSAEAHAFDPKSIELLESLADAAVFVAYGSTATKRLASVTPIPSAPANPPVTASTIPSPSPVAVPMPAPRPSKPMSSSGESATSVAPPALEPLPLAEIVAPARALPAAGMTVVRPAAKEALLPLIAPPTLPHFSKSPVVQTPKASIDDVLGIEEPGEASDVSVPTFTGSYEELATSSTSKKVGLAVAAAIVLTVPLWFFVGGSKAPAPQASTETPGNGTVSTSSAPPTTSTIVPPAAAAEMTVTPNGVSVAPAPSVPVTKHQTEKADSERKPPKKTEEEGMDEVITSKPAQAPIVLASARPINRPTAVEDSQAPTLPMQLPPSVNDVPAAAIETNSSIPTLAPRVTQNWTGGTIIKQVPPVYPQAAKSRGMHGIVELQFTVRKNGSVSNIRVISGNMILGNAAVDAVRLWRYEPFKADGKPVDVDTTVKLNFVMPN